MHHRENLRQQEYFITIVTIGDDSTDQRKDERGKLRRKNAQAQHKRRMRLHVNNPINSRSLHPRPHQRDRLTRKKEPIIAALKSPKGVDVHEEIIAEFRCETLLHVRKRKAA